MRPSRLWTFFQEMSGRHQMQLSGWKTVLQKDSTTPRLVYSLQVWPCLPSVLAGGMSQKRRGLSGFEEGRIPQAENICCPENTSSQSDWASSVRDSVSEAAWSPEMERQEADRGVLTQLLVSLQLDRTPCRQWSQVATATWALGEKSLVDFPAALGEDGERAFSGRRIRLSPASLPHPVSTDPTLFWPGSPPQTHPVLPCPEKRGCRVRTRPGPQPKGFPQELQAFHDNMR